MLKYPLNVAIIGLGGFARSHHDVIMEMEHQGLLKLCCCCDPEIEKFSRTITELKLEQRNVAIFNNFIDMLENFKNTLDFVTIPTPIHLHAEMHREALKREIPVYLEKPPTLDYQQLLEMIEIDVCAKKRTNVGFNFIIQKARQEIKKRIISGEFGKIKKITFLGMWPRPVSYFNRNAWAGKLMLNDRIILDSCFGNAISHYVHNILLWCGTNNVFSWDEIEEVSSELYRANNIQGTDTVFVQGSTKNVKDIRIVLTHACEEKTDDVERIICENAEIFFEGNAKGSSGTQVKCEIKWNNGKKEIITQPNGNLLLENILDYARYVAGEKILPLVLLEDTEPFVRFNGLIYIASGQIHTIPQDFILKIHKDENDTLLAIKNIREIAEEFLETARFPSQQGIKWAQKGSRATKEQIKDLRKFICSLLSIQ